MLTELAATTLVVAAMLVPAITKLSHLIREGGSVPKRFKQASHLLVIGAATTYVLAAGCLVTYFVRELTVIEHVAVAAGLAVLALVPYPVVAFLIHVDPEWDEDD